MTDAYTDESTRERDMKRKTNKQKNRVELAPWIHQIDRIERMLKWIIIEKMMDERIWRRMGEPQMKIPDISDILEEK